MIVATGGGKTHGHNELQRFLRKGNAMADLPSDVGSILGGLSV